MSESPNEPQDAARPAPDLLATQVMRTGVPQLTHLDTQPLRLVPPEPEPLPENITTQSLKVNPPFPEARRVPGGERSSRALRWAFGLLAVGILGGSLVYYFLYPSGEAPAVLQSREEVPPVLAPYMEKANQGDPGAMRMLGTMYYNGLNVSRDRKEGIKWYRKAAAAGSVAARKDLEQLGLAVDQQ